VEYFFIGSEELLAAFRFVGVDGVAALTRAEAVSAFERITGAEEAPGSAPGKAPYEEAGCKVLILEEAVAAEIESYVVDWQLKGRPPLIVEIPGLGGHIPGHTTLVDAIREAVGISI
jgi:V/A-type H+-transporting ATPase subunit F